MLRSRSELLAARPLIIGATSGIVGGGAFATLFHRAALDVHRAVFDRDQNTISLTLVDVGTVAGEALQSFRPKLAAQVEGASRISLLRQRVGGTATDIARIGDKVRFLALLLAGLTLAVAGGALALSRDRRRTASQLGVAAIAAGVVVVLVYFLGRVVVLARFDDPEDHAAAAAVYAGFLGDLRNLGFVVAGAGAIIAAAAASLIDPETFEAPVMRAWRIATTEPKRRGLRALRAVGLIAAGVLVVAEPSTALTIAAILAGVVLIQQGAETLLRLIYRPPVPDPEREAEAPDRSHRLRTLALGAAAVVVIAGAVTVFIAAGRRRAAAGRDPGLQRQRVAVRQAAGRGRAPGDAQLDVRAAEGLVLGRAGAADLRSARRRHPRPAARHALRDELPTAASAPSSPARRSCARRSARTAPATPASRRRCGCATASGSAARASAACTSATRSASSGRPRWSRCSTTSTSSSSPTRRRSS